MINASGVATTTATNNAKKNVEKVEKEVKTKPSKSPYLKLVTSESYADVVKGKNASLLSSEDVYFFVPTPNASYTNPDATIFYQQQQHQHLLILPLHLLQRMKNRIGEAYCN